MKKTFFALVLVLTLVSTQLASASFDTVQKGEMNPNTTVSTNYATFTSAQDNYGAGRIRATAYPQGCFTGRIRMTGSSESTPSNPNTTETRVNGCYTPYESRTKTVYNSGSFSKSYFYYSIMGQ